MRLEILAVFTVLCVAQISATPQVGVPGGLSPLTDYSNVRPALEKALTEAASVHKLTWTLIEILNAKSQVVAGARYVGEANFDEAGQSKKCKFEVIERPWDSYIKGILSCHPDYKEYTVEKGPVTKA